FKDRRKASKEAKARRKAIARSTLPNNFWLRQAHRLHPRRMAAYWFSKDGMIMALKIVGVAIVVCFVLLIGLFAYFRKDLPKINSLAGDKLGGSISYYDRTGKVLLWQDYGAVKRVPVSSNQMSPYMRNATVAIEDQHFYNEGAFNLKSIIRAGLHDVLGVGSGGGLQGASTITMQLVKLNEQWNGQRTFATKVKELILAIDLNREYSKKDILTGYLNIAPYGGVEYGCQSAAEDYFHTSCQGLTLAQSAFLAAIPQAPTAYSPYSDPKFNPEATTNLFNEPALLGRKNYVLDQMVKLGMITGKQAAAAKKVDVMSEIQPLQPKFSGIQDPYFVLAAKQELEQKYGAATVQRGGWKIITTLNLDVQNKADQIVQNNLPAVERAGGDEEAMVIEDVPTGQVVGLVGGTDFNNPDHGKINYASQVPISPGSSIKPYVYATLINNTNAGAGSVFYDSQGPIMDKSDGEGYPCT
ncbi:MAG: transglycosylase domain-containing protein, partial [Candidatus Saccharimonadales bacterium]